MGFLQSLQRRLTFANVISITALFIALGGTGYAAVTLPRNSVGAVQIRKDAVRAGEIKRSAVAGAEIKNGSLTAVEFAPGVQLKGDKGDKGDTGSVGAATVQFEQAATDLADGTSQSYNVFCPAGQQAIAGGARGDATDSEDTSITSSRPAISSGNTEPPVDGGTFKGWRITAKNLAGGVTSGIRPEIWVVCVAAPTTP